MLFCAHFTNSQETIVELKSNPYSSNIKLNINKSLVALPFFDDFSYNSNSVSSNNWLSSSVFLNRTYPINPPSIGVATFDGLNAKGMARNLQSNNLTDPSDTLTSQIIDLSNINSAYLLFYYQDQGLGDSPEVQDSFILEILNNTNVWEKVWFSITSTNGEFEKVVEIIDQSRFLHDSFQFRFRNYATISGNFDHWHLDYVKLDNFNVIPDTILNDLAFVYEAPNFLKRYSEMPWTHFVNNESNELNDSVDIKIRNNGAEYAVDYEFFVFEDTNEIYYYGPRYIESIYDYDSIGIFIVDQPPVYIQDNIFQSFSSDSTVFRIQHVLRTTNLDTKVNDTITKFQKFYSHFSYDDGTAESAYGINSNYAKLAYEFKLNRPDTLRAIQMYFPQMDDSVSNIPFKLTVWDDIYNSNILYQEIVYPVHTENGNFHTYYLDSSIKLVGSFYIGWEQLTSDLLNIGLDKNNIANEYMFYNLGSGWNNSTFEGSWMIRPVLNMNSIISATNNKETSHDILVYPNPSRFSFFIEGHEIATVMNIYSLEGVLLKTIDLISQKSKVNLDSLSSGVYLLEFLYDKNVFYKKIVVK